MVLDLTKLKLQYLTRILNSTNVADAVKLQALNTMMEANADNQDLVEELAMLKAPLDNNQLLNPDGPNEAVGEGEAGDGGGFSNGGEVDGGSKNSSPSPIEPQSSQPSPSVVSIPAEKSLAEKIRNANENKDSGDLIEEIRITTETMKFSFLRMKDHMANDDVIFDKAKQAQIKNEDGTKSANTSSSAFVAATRVGLIEMLIQICVALILGLAALYFV